MADSMSELSSIEQYLKTPAPTVPVKKKKVKTSDLSEIEQYLNQSNPTDTASTEQTPFDPWGSIYNAMQTGAGEFNTGLAKLIESPVNLVRSVANTINPGANIPEWNPLSSFTKQQADPYQQRSEELAQNPANQGYQLVGNMAAQIPQDMTLLMGNQAALGPIVEKTPWLSKLGPELQKFVSNIVTAPGFTISKTAISEGRLPTAEEYGQDLAFFAGSSVGGEAVNKGFQRFLPDAPQTIQGLLRGEMEAAGGLMATSPFTSDKERQDYGPTAIAMGLMGMLGGASKDIAKLREGVRSGESIPQEVRQEGQVSEPATRFGENRGWGTYNQYLEQNPFFMERRNQAARGETPSNDLVTKGNLWEMQQVANGNKPAYLGDGLSLSKEEIVNFARKNNLKFDYTQSGLPVVAKDTPTLLNVLDAANTLERNGFQNPADHRRLGLSLGYQDVSGGPVPQRTNMFTQQPVDANVRPVETQSVQQQGAELSPNLERLLNTNRDMIPPGEPPRVNDVQVPKETEFGKTRRFARTVAETVPEPDVIMKDVESGKFAYEPISNKETITVAENRVNGNFESSYQQWKSAITDKRRLTADDIALGESLLTKAAKDKNTDAVRELSVDLATELTNAGQVVQAARLLKRMSPEGYFLYVEKSIAKINRQAAKRFGNKAPEIKLTDAERQAILDAPDTATREQIGMQIAERIAGEMPVSFTEKFNAWRRIAMLFNPKTHIRNVLGNAVFIPMRKTADAVSMVLEKAFQVPQKEQSKSFGWQREPAIVKTVNSVWDEVGQSLIDNRRWDVASQVTGREKRIFKTNWLEQLNRFSGKALESEDVWFLERAFKDELGQVMKARNIKKPNEAAIIYASRRALEATYRDASALAQMIRQAKNEGGVQGVLLEALMPFEKTPINIAKRGMAYSPIGIMRGMVDMFGKVRRGTMPASEAIERLAQGVTGTGALLLGFTLAKMGVLTGPEDENRDKAAYERSVGKQPYAVKIGNSYYSWDWMQPVSMPIAMGVQVYLDSKDKPGFVNSIINATEAGVDTALNLPLFQGVKRTLKGYAINSEKGSQFLSSALTDLFTSYVQQALPTVGGQLARTIDPTIRTSYTPRSGKDIGSTLGRGAEQFGRYAATRIPGVSYALPAKTDVFGNDVTQPGGVVGRALQNFVSPGFYSEYKDSPATQLIQRVYDDTGEKGIIPGEAPKFVTYNKQKIYLTAEERNRIQRDMGRLIFERFTELAQDEGFARKPSKAQAYIMKGIVDNAATAARYRFVRERIKQ